MAEQLQTGSDAMGLPPIASNMGATAPSAPSRDPALDAIMERRRAANNGDTSRPAPDNAPWAGSEQGGAPASPLQVPPEAEMFERVIRQAEGTAKGDGNVLYGGEPFQPGQVHPKDQGWQGGTGPTGKPTSAAAWPQWEQATWHGEAERLKAMGVEPNFADSQQQKWAAWDLGSRTYQARTGRELAADIKTGKVDWSQLGGVWQGLQAGVGPHLVNGPFSPTAQMLVDKSLEAIRTQQPLMDEAIREAKDLHAMSHVMAEKWMAESDKPPKNMREAWSQWGDVAGALALVGGLMGGRSMTGALSAAGTMLQAANSADQKAYDDAYKRWGDHLDRGMKSIELLNKEAQDIIGDAKLSYDQQVGQLEILGKAYGLAQNFDHASVQKQLDDYNLMDKKREVIKVQNIDAATRIKDAAWLADLANAEKAAADPQTGKKSVPADVHLKNQGEAERDASPTFGAEKNQIQREVFTNLKSKYIAEGMSEADATIRAGSESGYTGRSQTGQLSSDAVKLLAKQYEMGDPGAITSMPRSGPARTQVENQIAGDMKGLDDAARQIVLNRMRMAEARSAATTAGRITMQTELYATEAKGAGQQVIETSKLFPRTNFPKLNVALEAFNRGTGDPNIIRFGTALNSLINAYGKMSNPTGTGIHDADKERITKILDTALSQGQIEAGVDQVIIEGEIVARAAEQAQGQVLNRLAPRPPGDPAPLPPAPSAGGKTVPQEAVEHLKADKDPNARGNFDAIFGPGAADRALGGR